MPQLPSPCVLDNWVDCSGEVMSKCVGSVIDKTCTMCEGHFGEGGNGDSMEEPEHVWFCRNCNCKDLSDEDETCTDGSSQPKCDDEECGDSCAEDPKTCADLKSLVNEPNGCASSCSQCMVDLFNVMLECKGT